MINDGYNRRVSFPEIGLRVIYRPALDSDGRRFRYEADYLNSADFCSQWLADHIVGVDWGRDPLFGCLKWTALRVVNRLQHKHEAEFRRLFLTIQGLVPDDSGVPWKKLESEYRENLRSGLELELTNPRLARRSCESCQTWWYREQTGLVILQADGSKLPRFGPTMCQTPMGCPKGTPDNPKTLNKANRWAWRHFRDCEAVGVFPADPIVMRNAVVIRQVMQAVEAKKRK